MSGKLRRRLFFFFIRHPLLIETQQATCFNPLKIGRYLAWWWGTSVGRNYFKGYRTARVSLQGRSEGRHRGMSISQPAPDKCRQFNSPEFVAID